MAPVKGCCDFCGRPSNDVLYGKLHRKRDIKCHYYCLLFSSTLDQNGKDEEGILGFLLQDIRKELEKGSKLNCSYCNRPGAVSKCFHGKCKKRFHLPCGMERGSLHLFFNDFRSYCGAHRIKQKLPADVLNSRDVNCSICFDPVEDLSSYDSIWAPCCKKNGWFHRLCLQKFALNAAYFFKCPLCANQREFRGAMLRNGIYIPDQDASWELVPNAFAELLERHEQCDAAVCKCPKGRKYISESIRPWDLMLCRNCASKGTHIGCIPGPRSSLARRSTWDCNDCQPVVRGQSQSQGGDIVSIGSRNSNYDEEEDEEEIIVVDDESENEVPEASSDISSSITNFGLASSNAIKILSNVIHLKSKSAELIDLVKEENEQMEVVVSDDEDPFPLDYEDMSSNVFISEISPDEPHPIVDLESNSVITLNQSSPRLLESSLAFKHQVGNHSFSRASQSGGVTNRGIFSGRNGREYLWRSSRKFCDKNFKGNSKTALSCYSTKENNCRKLRHHSDHYFGLRSGSLKREQKSCRNEKNCTVCKKMLETYAGRIYDNLLVDGWSEILSGIEVVSPDKTSNKISSQESPGKNCQYPIISSCSTYNKDICKLLWLKSAKWVCGATSCLSVLKHHSLESIEEYFNEPLKYDLCRNVEFCATRKTENWLKLGHDMYGMSIKELIGMLKL